MADLEHRLPAYIPMPPPFRREGYNPDEPIMIGSSDDEDEHVHHRPAGPARGTIEEQRARLHHNRTGTPIPRALENGPRILSPPPLPPPPHHHHWHRRPDWPHPHLHNQNPQSIQQRLAQIGMVRSPDALRRLFGHDQVGRILNLILPGFGDHLGQQPNQQQQARDQEYDVRMTHSRAKPKIGFSFDFAPDEEDENVAGEGSKSSAVRTRTTIVIPDSPPVEPVDRKGKGRAKTPPEVDEILDLESEEFAESASGPSTSVASPGSSRSHKRRAVETIEILSDDEEGEVDHSSVARTVLVCAGCQKPLRMGGERLWALRCGHMIDSRCYRKLGERAIVQELEPVLATIPEPEPAPVPAPSTSRPAKRRKVSGGRGRKPKAKPVVVAPVVPAVVEPYQAEILEWRCPVPKCGRAHWSERIVTGGKSAWQPMKETGAIGVFV